MKPNIVVEIFPDTEPLNPREDGGSYGIMACVHKKYNLSDEGAEITIGDFTSWKEVKDYLIKECGAVVILPLWLYDHGGISISTQAFYGRAQHAHWDSGPVGFIYATRESIEFGQEWKYLTKERRAKVEEYLRSEINIYDQYLTGDVYGYRISVDGEIIDSCYGFFGEELVKEEAIISAKRCVGRILEEELEITYIH
jgi:hypothetical protein